MRCHRAFVPLVVLPLLLLLSPTIVPRAGGGHLDQIPSSGKTPRSNPTDAEIRHAVTAIERADGYRDILEATERYEDVFSSARMVELADAQLQNPALDSNQRGLVILERQLSLDCRLRGAAAAARLLSVRLVAGYALLADSPQQFAGLLGKFSPLEKEMNVQLVREALDTPGNTWPKGLLPLMEQLARDWPEQGALAAAARMAEAAKPAGAPTSGPAGGQTVTGHWRSTTIVFESPRDEHLVLHPDGTAETWTVTASGRSQPTRGRWSSRGATLSVDWEDGRQWSQPFTFHEGQLVFPNIANRRQFWELVR